MFQSNSWKIISILFSVLVVSFSAYSQVLINEVCTSNSSVLADEDGSHPDWIELYNSGTASVNLLNYSISDNVQLPGKWKFPNYILAPGAYAIVYASDKNRKVSIDHWETAIVETDTWKYLVPSSEPPAAWKTTAFNDSGWSSGQGGFGNGDGDDNTVLATPLTSVYIRKTFTVTDLTAISQAALHMDYDDGYAAYLNGYLIASRNLPANPLYTTIATADHEAVMYSGGNPELKLINPDTLAMALKSGTNVLCIQVHNVNAASSDVSARAFLSFGINNTNTFYPVPPAWFNLTKNLPMHTNFKISDGETLFLSDASATIIDQKNVTNIASNHSYGRLPNGDVTWAYFKTPTPGAANVAAGSFDSYCNEPIVFSVDAGFYTSAQTVSLNGPATIRYTLDGSVPTASSPLYTTPITLPIDSTSIIRASCFNAGTEPLEVFTKTYLINKSTRLPVFSITTTPGLLFDPVTGIYMKGPNAQTTEPYFGANFWEDIDIPVHIEFFETDKKQYIDQDAELRIYGNYSRANSQKSFAIKANNNEAFEYSFFPDKEIPSTTQFVLRNAGNDFNLMHYRDGFIQKSVINTNIDIQNYRPAVVYVNGYYWGILNIREKINDDYVEHTSGIDKDKIDLAETWGDELSGSNNIWDMQWYASHNDLTVPANFKVVADSFDLNNLIDYFSTEIFISNWDWPTNNMKYWRPQEGSRKWRMILWDTDLSLGLFDLQTVDFNALGKIKNSADASTSPVATIFKYMLKNTTFRNAFINRYADLMNSTFKTSELNKTLYALKDSIDEEMSKHRARWTERTSWADWDTEIEKAKAFYTTRLSYARSEIKTEFGLAGQVSVTLQASPAGSGVIKINSIYPDVYPWTGIYFNGVPVEITAIANPGYTFSNWSANAMITSPNSTGNSKLTNINITGTTTFTANFTGTAVPVKLAISEINYNSAVLKNSGDWIELYNYGTGTLDLSGWYVKDDKEYNRFVIPAGTMLAAGERLVICNDVTKFKARYPTVTNYIGPMDFSLDNSGDNVRLYTYKGDLYTSVAFSDQSPWPLTPDGLGYTLELNSPSANPNLAASWSAGCLEGSPGKAFDPSCVTAVIMASEDSGILIFPNPASNGEVLNIRISSSININSYSIVNMQGSEMTSGTNTSSQKEFSLATSYLPAGIYTVLLYTETDTYIKKLIVQ